MREIRPLADHEFEAFVRLAVNAYPAYTIRTDEERQRMAGRLLEESRDPTQIFYGLLEENVLLGGMKHLDFTMNLHGTQTLVAGIAEVAVDLLRKKEHVARDLVLFFLEHARANGAALALLYPFRPDFYKQMGFGYGTKINEYRVSPANFPKGPSKRQVVWTSPTDAALLLRCYQRYQARTHGVIQRSEAEFTRLLAHPEKRVVAYRDAGAIKGYLVFSFRRHDQGNFLINDLHVDELVYETREALSQLLTFLQSQADQVRAVVIRTQEEAFHHLLLDPRNGSELLIPSVYHPSNVQGVGLMYRVLDTRGIFEQLREHSFGGVNCRVKITLVDSFFPSNAGSLVVQFAEGRPTLSEDERHDVEIRLEVAEFSSLLLGVVNFQSLYRYHLADISDPGYLETINRLFYTPEKPICLTAF
ncbi:MAG TPA: GNAT family N-acetyltransferase [Ktedonobacterales bacterium]